MLFARKIQINYFLSFVIQIFFYIHERISVGGLFPFKKIFFTAKIKGTFSQWVKKYTF